MPDEIDNTFYLIFIIIIVFGIVCFYSKHQQILAFVYFFMRYYCINVDLCLLYCASIGACFGNSGCSSQVTNQSNG